MSAYHALIIDDNPLNIEVLAMMLHQNNFDATSITTLTRVKDVLDSLSHLDILFLDLELPNGNGFDLFQEIRKHPVLKDVPVVAYSVHTSEIDQARRAGFHSFLGKPLKAQKFPEQIKNILSGVSVWEV